VSNRVSPPGFVSDTSRPLPPPPVAAASHPPRRHHPAGGTCRSTSVFDPPAWFGSPGAAFRGKLVPYFNPTRPAMKIERIDHLNLTVADIDRSIAFYKRVLGMEIESMGEGRAALHFGQQKIHLDLAGGAMASAAEPRQPAHICFVTEAPMGEVKAHLEECGVAVRMEGPRAGAIGEIQSVYVDDPDRNSIEISSY
jgi:catechol 2,3-dioxygenase-like lactoylglutathione lyase family enzyme